MVRETRHLWVGNLPDNIREEDIVEHFKRYGRVQSVKVVSRGAESGPGPGGACATVSFMDIKSASKAHSVDQKLEECALTTEYHEPAAIPREPPPTPSPAPATTPLPLYSSPRFNHGSSTEEVPFDRSSSHFYAGEGETYARRSSSTYHSSSSSSSENLRGRPRDRLYRNGPYPIIESVVARTPGASSTGGSHHRDRGAWNYEGTGRYTPPDHPSLISPRRDNSATTTTTTTTTVSVAIHRKKHSKSRSGSNGSESGGSNSISSSRSRSRSNSSSSRSSSASSPHSSPSSSKTCSTRRSRSTLQSAVSTNSPGLHSEDRRALAICVRNLPARSSDTSLKDGLYHEYKKHGKVSWVKIIGQGGDRYGLVCFKKADDAEKAILGSHEKHFFGCKIDVSPYHDVDFELEFRPYEAELDEFHPKATRTLFIGNLEKDITASELQKHFDQFGQIIFVDIKKQSSSSAFAFVQYTDIASVVRAMRAMDGEYVGHNRVNLGYGKSLATTCVWVDGVADNVSDKYLSVQFSQFGPVSHVEIDRSRGQALVFYQQVLFAQLAVNGMRGVVMRSRKLQVDFASRECQDAFYESQKSSNMFDNSMGASPASSTSGGGGGSSAGSGVILPVVRGGLDTPSSSSSGGSTSSSRPYRHSTSRPSPIYSRGASPPPLTPKRHATTSSSALRCDYTNEYVMDRRPPYRSFEDAVIEEKMVVVIQQAPSEMRHQKERMSLDEEDTSEHRRKCKHRRSHSGENSRPGTPLCDEKPEYTSSKHHDTTSAFPLFSNSLSLSKPPPSPPPSPPLRPPSSSSEDSEPSTSQLSDWELRLKSLDERYEKWSGNRTVTATTKTDSSSTGQKVRHKLLDLNVHELQPSDIVKSVLAKRSIFDEDSKRLENMNDKYEPKEYIPSRIGLQNFRSYLPPTPTPPVPINKGLQYPFPSHPHVVNNCHPPPPSRTVSLETSKPVVPMPNNIRRNSTNSNSTTLGDTARRRSREEPQQPIETKNVNETRIKLETKPSTETSTNMTSDNKDVKAIPSPSEDIKPAIEEGPHLVENNCTVDVKPSPESLPKSEPVLVIKHELPSAPEVKTSAPTIIERRKSTSIEEVKPSNRETIEEKAECNTKTLNHANSVLTPCVTSKPKDCDLTDVDNNKCKQERDIERDRRKSKDIVVENSSSSSSIDTTSKTKPNETSTDKVDSKEKKDVKHNCVDVHSKHKDRRDSEKRKEKENVEVKSNNQRKDHDNHKSQVNDRRSSKEEHEDREKKRNNEHSSSKQHKSRESESEHSTSRHHNNVARKDKHKSSSRHKESDKKSHDHEETKRKDSHDESKRKETHQDEHRKRENHEDKKKDNAEDSKKKDHEESKKKDKDHDEKRKESCEEKRKDVSEDKRRETVDDHKRKDSGEERRKDTDDHKRKEVDDHKRKEIVDDHKRKDIVDDHRRKESCEEKRKEILDDHKRKESTDDHKRKENTDDHKRKENTDDHKRKETVDDHKRKESVDDHKRKESVDDHKRKESVDDHKRKESTDDHKRKENTDDHKRKEPVEDKRKESTEEKRKEVEDKRKENCDERRKDSFEEKRREIVDDHRKKDTVDEAKRKDVAEDHKRKESVEEHKRKDHDDRHSRDEKESHSHTPRHNSHNKDKEHRDSCDTKHEHSGHKKKDSEDSNRVKRKDSDHHHHDSSKRKEEERNKERRKERYSLDSTETVVKKENEAGEKKKEFDMFKVERKRSYDNSDKTRKEETVTTDKKETSSLMENISDAEESADKRNHIRKEQRKDRTSNNSWHATVGCKRRLSSQDSQDSTLEDIKRMKPERRDSKDSKDSNKSSTSTSSSSSSSSQKKHSDKDKHQKIAKMLEEKIKEDKEKESHVKPKKENKESDDNDSPKARKEKKNSETKLSENESGEKKKRTRSIRENGLTTCSESETGSCDDEGRNKKHSIFDIVDDTPAYISMYDKVKARSCKNMQKHEEEQKKKEKFTQLKQSRAKREEKKRSTSYDEDTDSERGIGRRNSKHMITSSEDDFTSECETNKTKSKKTIMSDTSDDDVVKSAVKSKLKAKSRLLRSEESELDSTQDSMQSFIKSEPKVKIEREENTNTTASIKEEHGAEEKDISVNNKTSVDTDSETHGKKKSHRKKEKRQKSMDSSLSCSDINLSSKKEKHKKERRKSHNHDSDASGKHVKSRKKKTSSSKKDIKLETSLFEPLSDDSSTPMMKDQSMSNNTSKWQVGQVFSDSDSDEITRIQDKKRRERKSRELDEAGKALEAKLLDETDHFDATSVLVEKVKKKKKKKKKHHNHHKQRNIEHEEGDGDDEDEEARSAENEPTPPITAQCLSSLLESPPLSVAANKKPDIPGFGLPMDAHVHDSAVKSISECENLPAMKKIPDPEPAPVEEKPTVVISQEETEDAVAALLGDAFGGHFEEDYNMEDNKPGSPENLSEPDLQIDTDTEDTFDTLDFSKPPRTPDYPSHFENFTGKDKIKPGFVPPKTPDTKSVELAKKPNHEMKTETQGSPQQANVTKGMKQDKTPEPSPVKLPELRPFDTFKPEDKPAESRGYASLEVVNKTSKATNVPSSSVLFTEQSLLKHNKTTELLSHGAWTDKPLANLHNKPITSLEQSIHKTVNLMDQYINKSPKPALDQIIKSKNQENVVYKPNNTTSNMLHPYDRVTSSEQVFTNKPVVLSEQYKNIQNPDLVKNCIVSSELMHQKSILSVCKPPMSDVKSVITINKCIVTPSSLHDPHKTMNKSVVVPTSLQDATKTNKSIGVPTSLQDKTINKTVVVSTSVHDAQRIINKPITPTSLSDASKLINKTVVVSTSLLESSKTMNKFVTTSTPLHDDNRSLVIPSSLQETAQNMNRTVVTTSLADASKFINKSIGVPTSLHDKIVTTSVVVSTSQQDLSKSINKSIGVTSLQDKPTIKPIVASPFLQDAAKNKPLVSPTSLPDAHKVMNKPVVTPTTLQDPSKTINKFVTVPTSLQDKPMNRSILVPTSLHETSKINKPVPTTVHSVQDVSTNKFVGVPTALPDKSVNPCTVATALPDFKGTVKSPAETNVQTHSAATTPEPPKQTSPSPKDSAFSHLIQAIDQTMANEKADKSVNAFSKPDEDKPNHVSPVTIKEEDLIAKQKLEKLYSNIQPDKYQFGNKTLTITDHTYVVNSCDTPSKSAVPEHNEAKPECKPEPNIVKFVEELEQQLNEEKSQNLRKQNLALEEKTQQNQHRNVLPEDKSQQNQHRNVPLPEDKSQQNQQHRNVPLPEEKSQQTQHQNLPLAEEKSQQPQHRNLLVEESRKQHLDLLEKKEDHVGPIVAPLTPKMEEKPAIFVSPGESSCEPKDVESAQTRKEITEDIKDKSDEDSSGRRGRRRKNNASTPATSRMGGVVTRRTRFSNPVTSPAPATSETKPSPPAEEVKPAPAPERKCLSGDEVKSSDVYEFKDDSDEDEAATRPLLSIKSPHDAKSPHDTKVHDVKSPRDMRSPHESKSPRPHDTKHDAKSPAEHKPDTKSPETKGTPKPASEKTSHETKASQDAKPHELKSPDKSSPDVKSEKSDAVAMVTAPVSVAMETPSPPPPASPSPLSNTCSASTRKSRRLQEKDVCRNTVDDTIDEVIRTARTSGSTIHAVPRRTTRSQLHASSVPSVTATELTRKSPRRKANATAPAGRGKDSSPVSSRVPAKKESDESSTSNPQESSGIETGTCTSPLPSSQPEDNRPRTPIDTSSSGLPVSSGVTTPGSSSIPVASVNISTPSPTVTSSANVLGSSTNILTSSMNIPTSNSNIPASTPTSASCSVITMTSSASNAACVSTASGSVDDTSMLIDPVSGELIPVRQAEEGQYIPVQANGTRAPPEADEPAEKRQKIVTSLPHTLSQPTPLPQPQPLPVPLPQPQHTIPLPEPPSLRVSPPGPTRVIHTEPQHSYPMPIPVPLSVATPTIVTLPPKLALTKLPNHLTKPLTVNVPQAMSPKPAGLSPSLPHHPTVLSPLPPGSNVAKSSPLPQSTMAKFTTVSVPLQHQNMKLPPGTTMAHLVQPTGVKSVSQPQPQPQPQPKFITSPAQPPGKMHVVASPQPQPTLAKFTTVSVPFQPQPALAKFVTVSTAMHQPTAAKITSVASGQPQPITKFATISTTPGLPPGHMLSKIPAQSNLAKITTMSMPVQPQPTLAKFTTVTTPVLSQGNMSKTPQPQPVPINPKAHLLNRTKVQAPMTPKAHILQSIANGPTSLEAPVSLKPGGSSSPGVHAVPRPIPMDIDAPRPVPYEASSMAEVIPSYQHAAPGSHYVHHPTQLSMYHHYLRDLAQGGYHITPGGKDKEDSGTVVVAGAPTSVVSSPHERATDSPQVATLYAHGSRLLFYETPPPGFRTPRHLTTPPHASPDTPLSTDTLYSVLERRYPVMWQGELVLKSDQAFVQMHYVFGNHLLARDALPLAAEGGLTPPTPTLRIAQRMRLEQTQIDGVVRKMQTDGEHCMLLALPCGRTEVDVVQQSAYLQSGFITYLQQKQAAGIVNIAAPGTQQAAYIVHVFPSCEFANNSLAQIDAQLLKKVSELTYLVIIIATTANSATV